MGQNGNIEISGVVDSVIFENRENGYTICEIETDDGQPVVLAGSMSYISSGDRIKAIGSWVIHPTYGKQLRVTSYEKHLPEDKDGILRYLSSRAVKGIGPRTAVKIVDKFGDETFDVIENRPDWLAEINGISKKKALEISAAFKEASGSRGLIMRFRDYLSDAMSMKIYKKWGGSAVDRIRENPYILCDEFRGISFAKADAVAESLGIEKNSPLRLCGAAAAYLRNAAAKDGHTCVPLDFLKAKVAQLLDVSPDDMQRALVDMTVSGKIKTAVYKETRYVYLSDFYRAEKYTAERLLAINSQCASFDEGDIDRLIMKVERESSLVYDSKQRSAIHSALGSGVMILTGGPGTGKTTVIKGIISIFLGLGMDVALAAPTGRAAKRMSEATSFEASTVHRLLCMEYSDGEVGRFTKNENDRLDEDVIIIDEASMIDILLMEAFLRAVKPGARIILIGDSDQLPSVGAGNVLGDLIESGRFNTVKLTKIFRQDGDSRIISNAHAINSGVMPDISNKSKDFFFLSRPDDADTAATVCELCAKRLPKKYGDDARGKIQILTPSKKGVCGTENLNVMLQECLNPRDEGKKERRFRDIVFREGDRVMQTRNNYALAWKKDGVEGEGIFNGDIGTIEKIDNSEGIFVINFDDRICEYDVSSLDELEHAWAVTVHKSQGSEYPYVIFPLYSCAPMLLTRNLFYTAVTRAKKMVILVGKRWVVSQMVENERHAVRYTGLCDMLKRNIERGADKI